MLRSVSVYSLARDQTAGRGLARVQVECRARGQNVQREPEHAHRLPFADLADRRVLTSEASTTVTPPLPSTSTSRPDR